MVKRTPTVICTRGICPHIDSRTDQGNHVVETRTCLAVCLRGNAPNCFVSATFSTSCASVSPEGFDSLRGLKKQYPTIFMVPRLRECRTCMYTCEELSNRDICLQEGTFLIAGCVGPACCVWMTCAESCMTVKCRLPTSSLPTSSIMQALVGSVAGSFSKASEMTAGNI